MSPSVTQPGGHATNGVHAKQDSRTLDARVHRIESIEENAVTILLRRMDQFTSAVIESSVVDVETFTKAQSLTAETLLRVTGSEDYNSQQQKNTLRILEMDVLAAAKPDIPTPVLSHGAPGDVSGNEAATTTETVQNRLDNRVLDARVYASSAVAKLFSAVFELAVEQLTALDFWRIPTPTLIGYEFPGDEHEQFALNYFDRETAWLSQTGEVHLEMALAADFERVYDVHSVFRQEENATARYMTEFTMLEIMWVIKRDWTEIMEFSETFIISMTHALQNRERYSTLTTAAKRIYPRAGDYKLGLDKNGRMLRLKFREAKRILRELFGRQTDDLVDITAEEEAILGKYLASDESTVGPPTDIFFLTHFPRGTRSYNIFPSPDNDVDTLSFDIIMCGQEIGTGYQCMNDYKELRHAMATRKHPIDPDSVAWKPFVEAHDLGMPPLGGVGIGLNRFVQGFLGASDIRDTALFPRDALRLRP